MAHELPPLPYDYTALEPFIDEKTMHLHHDMHHAFEPGRIPGPLPEFCRHHLPGETEFIREPTALHFLSAVSRELRPVIIDLLLCVAVDHK